MTTRSTLGGLLLIAALLLAACDAFSDDEASSPSGASVSATPAASATPATTPAGTVGQTQTEFGVIWDGVPAGFPRYNGARDADDAGPTPVSDRYVVEDADPAVVAEWLQTAMEAATYSTEALSGPFEDGGYELVSVGDGECRIQTTIAPMGSLVLVSVLYGADCPAA